MSFEQLRMWDVEIQLPREDGTEEWVYAHTCLGWSLRDVLDRVADGSQRPAGISVEDCRVKPVTANSVQFGNTWEGREWR